MYKYPKEAHRIQGISEYYFAAKLAQISQMDAVGEPVINLGIGSPDLPPHASVIEALKESFDSPAAHKYQAYKGIPQLRNAFAEWYKRHFDVALNPNSDILPLLGSKEAVMHISMALLEQGDEVLIPNPGYPSYLTCTKISGATPVPFDLVAHNKYLPDLDALSATDLSKVKIMWLNYPNMPTGAVADLGFFRDLLHWAKTYNILVCHDNPYTFILNQNPISILQVEDAFPHFLELTSLSKNYHMAGWRIGAIAAHETILNSVTKFKSNMDSGMFYPLQKAAVQALSLESTWFDSINIHYKERKKSATQILKTLGCTIEASDAGMFLWAKVPKNTNGEMLTDQILSEARVFITPGFIFGSKGYDYIRISLCSPISDFEAALNRILKAKNILS